MAAPQWAVDPQDVGPGVPPRGRSLFDAAMAGESMTYAIPFPFEALIRKVEKAAGCAGVKGCTTSVLIPMGRSLQRLGAAPDYFRFPRAVVAVTGEPTHNAAMLLKDRVYLGYQEKAQLIEVISYNETAGRFEFQLVKDYRTGAKPRVVHANRAVCLSCHQNQAPIFSRQVWDETNANPAVADRLMRARADFYGIPVRRGIDTPNAIDDAVARANELAVMRRLWREGCGESSECRRLVVRAALQYRLSGGRAYDEHSTPFRQNVVDILNGNAMARWHDGLALPNAGLPNRDPFAQYKDAAGTALAHIPAALEPLRVREPSGVLHAADGNLAHRLVTGVAALWSEQEISHVRSQLRTLARSARTRHKASCKADARAEWRRQTCTGEGIAFSIKQSGRETTLEAIAMRNGQKLQHYVMRTRQLGQGVLRFAGEKEIRLQDGNLLEGIEIETKDLSAVVTVADDFDVFEQSIGMPSVELTRNVLLKSVGLNDDIPSNPSPASDEIEALATDMTQDATLFHRHCARCHRTQDRVPPNFLHGDAARVSASLRHCAPRIYVRLSMGLLTADQRGKTPMPPPAAARDGTPAEVPLDRAVTLSLRDIAANLIRSETGQMPILDTLLARGYENLPPCLPQEIQ